MGILDQVTLKGVTRQEKRLTKSTAQRAVLFTRAMFKCILVT